MPVRCPFFFGVDGVYPRPVVVRHLRIALREIGLLMATYLRIGRIGTDAAQVNPSALHGKVAHFGFSRQLFLSFKS